MSDNTNSQEESSDRSFQETPEGRRTARLYADIIHLSRPVSQRPRMDLVQRAKIFAPYDALRGFDEAIDAEDEKVTRVEQTALSEEEQQTLSEQLNKVRKGQFLRVCYFNPEGTDGRGHYQYAEGRVLSVDPVRQCLSLAQEDHTGQSLPLAKTPPLNIAFARILTLEFIHIPVRF